MEKKNVIIAVIMVLVVGGWFLLDPSFEPPQQDTVDPSLIGETIEPTKDDPQTVTIEDEDHNLVEVDISDWPYYRNEVLGFEFRYPREYSLRHSQRRHHPVFGDKVLTVMLRKMIDEKTAGHTFSFKTEFADFELGLMQDAQEGQSGFSYEVVSRAFLENINAHVWAFILSSNQEVHFHESWFEAGGFSISARTSNPSLARMSNPSFGEELQAILLTFKVIQ